MGQEQLNQTWPPPASGRHSPRIPKKNSSKKRGRRILEPLNGSGNKFKRILIKISNPMYCIVLY